MNSRILMWVRGEPVFITAEDSVYFDAGMTIDADGSPRAYAPPGSRLRGLDDLSNAGSPGNWYGVVTDNGARDGQPVVQGRNAPEVSGATAGYCVSPTAYERPGFARQDPRRYLDSETVLFMVVPGPLRRKVGPIVLGCRALVRFGPKCVEAVVGDIGPATHLGEGSIALARALGINSDPRHGGCPSGVRYTIFPGQAAQGFELQAA